MDTSGVELSLNKSMPFSNTSQNSSNVLEGGSIQLNFPLHMQVLVTFAFILVFITGIVGNLMVILVVVRNLRMRSSTNLFLVNLSALDLAAILFCVPSAMAEFYSKDVWYLGRIMCKFVYFLEYTVVNTSVLVIMAISFERYLVICCPLRAKSMCTTSKTVKTIIVIWMVGMVMNSPFLQMPSLQKTVMLSTREEVQVCHMDISNTWSRLYIITTVCVFFILPFIILVFLYGCIIYCLLYRDQKLIRPETQSLQKTMRTRRQVVLMLISVIVLFFVCLLPFRVLSLWPIYADDTDLAELGFHGYYSLLYFSRIMLFINSAGNPILYNLFSSKFRQAFKSLLCSRYSVKYVTSVTSQSEAVHLNRKKRNRSTLTTEV